MRRRIVCVWLCGLVIAMMSAPVLSDNAAVTFDQAYPVARDFFPPTSRFTAASGEPPAATVYRDDRVIGYVFETFAVLRIPAYSGKPINNVVGLDTTGRITGVAIVAHEEPVLLVGITDADLARHIEQYRGQRVFDRIVVGGEGGQGKIPIDGISGATITAMVENATVLRAARRVAASRSLPLPATQVLPPANIVERVPNAAQSPIRDAQASPGQWSDNEPIWKSVWQERRFRIAVLLLGLALLTLILIFQDGLARHPRLLIVVRNGYLVFTLLFIGWYGLAQLSVVNVLTFTHAIVHDFQWESFLIDPMMFLLWSFVAVTLVLWGRGVYCGWLCPFGALQELTNQLGRRLKLKQREFPHAVHERLWALKYLILLVLFGVSLQSLGRAEVLAEVEPFKTAITMRFQREWGFVLFAAILVAMSLVNRKFYCKYLCPLGAALTFPARFRIFDWLRRRKECGSPCQVCAKECEVQAIDTMGRINANECHYCLDCQVTYYNEYKCPPQVARRKRRERAPRALQSVRAMESVSGPSGLPTIPIRSLPDDSQP